MAIQKNIIKRSLREASWVLSRASEDDVVEIAKEYELPEMIARLLVLRGVQKTEVESFIQPTLAKDFPDPFSLKDMDSLADTFSGWIKDGKKFGVFGDFDVDGATSAAIVVRFFRHLRQDIPFYIPDRIKEGYGPNKGAMKSLKDQGVEVVLICDCGVTAHDVVSYAKDELGMHVIILDHHEAEETLPDADFVIDPKRQDDQSGLDMLAACGVVYLTCVALNSALRKSGFYTDNGLTEPPLKDWIDLVALGTVCDMVPLQGANRLFVKKGFEQLSKRSLAGIQALTKVSGLQGPVTPYHAGFILGPRINAGSRVHEADLGTSLLTTDDYEDAERIAWILNDCNDKRKAIESEMLDEAIDKVESEGLHDKAIIVVGDENWHPGLSGLVAGRLKEKYQKPAVAITYAMNEKGQREGRGSGRSIQGLNIGQAFIEAKDAGLLLKGGGHAMAAGFTVDPSKENDFIEFLDTKIKDQMTAEETQIVTSVDSVITIRGISVPLIQRIQSDIGPFGQGNEEPIFLFENVRLHMIDTVGKDHIRAMVSDWEGGTRIKAMAFRSADTPMGQSLLTLGRDQPFHILGTLKVDNWSGEDRAEILIKDASPVMAGQKQQVA